MFVKYSFLWKIGLSFFLYILQHPLARITCRSILACQWTVYKSTCKCKLGPSINGLVTEGNIKLCCRGSVLALFQSTTACKIDSKNTQDYIIYIPGMYS